MPNQLKQITKLNFYSRRIQLVAVGRQLENGVQSSFHDLSESSEAIADDLMTRLLGFLESESHIRLSKSFRVRMEVRILLSTFRF